MLFKLNLTLTLNSTLYSLRAYFATLVANLGTLNTTGMSYIRNLLIVLLIDTMLIDDEPLWEPLEWTLTQTWVLFILLFSWIAEVLITGKYGSFTGRDKRVYQGLFKAYWLLLGWFAFNVLLTIVLLATPFYFETNYSVSAIVSWWNWYNKIFFCRLTALYFIIAVIFTVMSLGLKWISWRKLLTLSLAVLFILSYLFYTQFIITFFAYFTDEVLYKKTGWSDYNGLSHGPLKWGWGSAARDHFSYHQTPTAFWNKNDNVYSSAMFLCNIFIVFVLFLTTFQWLLVVRRIYAGKEISFTFLTYGISTVKQFFYSLFCLFPLALISFFYQYLRTSGEFFWYDKVTLIFDNYWNTLSDYPAFVLSFFS